MSSAIANGPQTLTGNSLSSTDLFKAPTLPSWLSTDPTSTTKQLQDSYNGIDAAYDPTAQVASLQKQSSGAVDTANRASNNAASEYAYRDMLSGGNAGGAGAMKAQIQLQGLNQANQYGTQAATISDTARQQANTAKLGAAEQMGSIQNNYLGTLASFYSNMQNSMNQQAQITSTNNNALLNANAQIAINNANAKKTWNVATSSTPGAVYSGAVNNAGQPNTSMGSGSWSVYGNPSPTPYFT
jgi:hypothetical protein